MNKGAELFRFSGASGFGLLNALLCIDAEDQPHRNIIGLSQFNEQACDVLRVAFPVCLGKTETSVARGADLARSRGKVPGVAAGAAAPVGANAARLQGADLDTERTDLQSDRIAEAADGPLGRVIRTAAWKGESPTD